MNRPIRSPAALPGLPILVLENRHDNEPIAERGGQPETGTSREEEEVNVLAEQRQVKETVTELEQEVLKLGRLVETAIARTIEALVRHDTFLARAIIKEDREIDLAEVRVQEHCVQFLEQLRPAGGLSLPC